MGKRDTLKVKVLAEKGTVFAGDCEILFAPGILEPLAILPFHTPMIARLGAGEISAKSGKRQQSIARVESGLLYVGENEVTILVDL